MICFPNCKINLGLFVTNKRDDGYHDIETVFYALNNPNNIGEAISSGTNILNDVLEVVPAAGEASLSISGLSVEGEKENNLVWKAYQMLKEDFGEKIPELDIYLHKAVPMGAGLGGGSADGTYMLRLLNDYCKLGLPEKEMLGYALRLGSDCPFFLAAAPQYATGRGEIMQPVDVSLADYDIQIICPGNHVSTQAAFAGITPQPARYLLKEIASIPVQEWKNVISNDFETTVFASHPVLGSIKEQMYKQGAVYASMTGTGSAIYGIFGKGGSANIIGVSGYKEYIVAG